MTRSFSPLDDQWLRHLAEAIRPAPDLARPQDLTRLQDSFEMVRYGEAALALALFQKQIAGKKFNDAQQTGLWLLAHAALPETLRELILFQQAFVSGECGAQQEKARCLLQLFALRPSYELALRIIATSGMGPSDRSPYDRVKDLYYDRISSALPPRIVPVIDQDLLRSMQISSAPRSVVDLSGIPTLNQTHPFCEAFSAQTELTPLEFYEVPGALILANAVSYEVYDRQHRFIPELSSGDAAMSGRPPLRPHRLAGRAAIVANYAMKGCGSAWFIDEMATIIAVLRRMKDPVEHWVFSERPTAMKLDALGKLGIMPEQVVSLEQYSAIEAEVLVAVSGIASQSRGSLRSEWQSNIEVLRTLLLGHHHVFPSRPKRRLFLSPPEQRVRELVIGWEALYEQLHSEFNFERVHLDALSFAARVELFADAEFVIGFHGSAMLDLPLVNPQVKILEILHPHIGSGIHAALARMLGLNYCYICGENDVIFSHDEKLRSPEARPVVRIGNLHRRMILNHLGDEIRRISPPVPQGGRTIVEVPRVEAMGMHISLYENIRVDQKPNALSFLASFVSHKKIDAIIEIGTGFGGLTKVLLDHTAARVLTIDIEDRSPHLDEYSERLEKIVGDCFAPDILGRLQRFKQGARTLILCDGGNKPREFNQFKVLLEEGEYIMVHDFAPSAEEFQELLDSHFWLAHECAESQLDLRGLARIENFETIWKGFIWGGYRCTERIGSIDQSSATLPAEKAYLAAALDHLTERYGRNDLDYLFTLGKSLKPGGRYVELGSGIGISAIAVASGVDEGGNVGAQIFCVDTWKSSGDMREVVETRAGSFKENFHSAIERSGVGKYIAPLEMSAGQAATLFTDGFFDVIYICQRQARVQYLETFDQWQRKCRSGGIIACFGGAENTELESALAEFTAKRKITAAVARAESGNIWTISFEPAPTEAAGRR